MELLGSTAPIPANMLAERVGTKTESHGLETWPQPQKFSQSRKSTNMFPWLKTRGCEVTLHLTTYMFQVAEIIGTWDAGQHTHILLNLSHPVSEAFNFFFRKKPCIWSFQLFFRKNLASEAFNCFFEKNIASEAFNWFFDKNLASEAFNFFFGKNPHLMLEKRAMAGKLGFTSGVVCLNKFMVQRFAFLMVCLNKFLTVGSKFTYRLHVKTSDPRISSQQFHCWQQVHSQVTWQNLSSDLRLRRVEK